MITTTSPSKSRRRGVLTAVLLGIALAACGQTTTPGRRWWPDIVTAQYAGNIGFWSAGLGWDYGKRQQWETHLMVGYLPSWIIDDRWTMTVTLKQHYTPWNLRLGQRWQLMPLTASLAVNTIMNNNFWVHEPERYGHNYYNYSTALRLHLGMGSRFGLTLPPQWRGVGGHRVMLYYELSTYDAVIISAATNRSISLADILALGFGVQYKF